MIDIYLMFRASVWIYLSSLPATVVSTAATPSSSSTPQTFPLFCSLLLFPTSTLSLRYASVLLFTFSQYVSCFLNKLSFRCWLSNSTATSWWTCWEFGLMLEVAALPVLTLLVVFVTTYLHLRALATSLKTLSTHSSTSSLCLDPVPSSPRLGLRFQALQPRM